jgi:predicted XRE-type DNA-binding protein
MTSICNTNKKEGEMSLNDFIREEVKEKMSIKKLKQIEVATQIGCSDSQFNKFICGWREIPKKYINPLSKYFEIWLGEDCQ